jgi:AcrR family transcriptional regulator
LNVASSGFRNRNSFSLHMAVPHPIGSVDDKSDQKPRTEPHPCIEWQFTHKEHLFISMVREITKTTFDTVHEMFESHKGSTAELLRAQFSFFYQNIVEDRRRRDVLRMLIAEAPRFPELADRYYNEIIRPCLNMLTQAIQRGVDRGEIRKSSITDSPQVIIAPIALVDMWMMMFDDRQPLDLKTYFDAHLELVLNGLLAKS